MENIKYKKPARPILDIVGQRFGKLVVQEFVGMDAKSNSVWLCKCDCGNTSINKMNQLKNGKVKSCGCMKGPPKHHQTGTRIYRIWRRMRERCKNPNSTDFYKYGERGISVCKEWDKFENFYEWAMAHGYREDLSIDRIDNNGNYTPDNCRWGDRYQQMNNRRNNRIYTYQGKTQTLAEWSRELGLDYKLLHTRLRRGHSFEEAINMG